MRDLTSHLLPSLIARRRDERRPYAYVASPTEAVAVTFADLDRASDVAAWVLKDLLAEDEVKFFYMGRSDIRHLVWVIGAAKAGKCIVFPSPGNTTEANLQLFKAVGARKLLYTPESLDSLAVLIEAGKACDVSSFPTPVYDEVMMRRVDKPYPFTRRWEEVKNDAVMGLHTSGTSGHPKPLYWSLAAIQTLASHGNPAAVNATKPSLLGEVEVGQTMFLPFPLFHMGGIGPSLGALSYEGTTVVFPIPGLRLSPENIDGILRRTRATTACMPPSLIESTISYEPALQSLAQLRRVAYLGGPLNPILGKKLARRVPGLCSMFGTTEGGAAHLVCPEDNSCWDAMRFIDLGQRMEELSSGLYELVFPRTELINRTTGYFHTQPHLATEFRTKDLFSMVRGRDGWWTYRGRADNLIAMSNGLKMDPAHLEDAIGARPEVKGVVVAGEGRPRLCLLVELHEPAPVGDEDARDTMRGLWPTIEQANRACPKFGRIPRELVLFATRDKPFMRASKGTIQRRLTVAAYEHEIEDLYTREEEGLLTQDLPAITSTDTQHLTHFTSQLYSDILDAGAIGEHDDLLALGLDSLAAKTTAARLKACLRRYGAEEEILKRVDMKLVYAAATPSQLAERLRWLLLGSDEAVPDTSYEDAIRLLRKYETQILHLPTPKAGSEEPTPTGGKVVVLTGSTGTVGSYILSWLLSRSDVERVICLNRGADAESRQRDSFKSKGLAALPEGDGRVRFMRADLADVLLGLDGEDYELVRQQATHLVHNSFPVNFLMSVRSFEPQMAALVNLARLARLGSRSPAFMFISSIAAATPVSGDRDTIEEMVLSVDQARDLLPQGYAQTKFVCEHLLSTYAAHTGGSAVVLRVGQVCGPLSESGTWNVSEWFPSLVISSKQLGIAPDSIGPPVNWVPVDVLGEIVSELLDRSQERLVPGVLVYNVVNPTPAPWEQLAGALDGVVPAVVTTAEWLSRLEESADGRPYHSDKVVGTKLIDFYRAMLRQDGAAKIQIDHLVRHSHRAASLAPIGKGDIMKWMKAWNV